MEHTIIEGERMRNWGGWYKHWMVMVDGVEIGRIQEKQNNGRRTYLTCAADGYCVHGRDINWLFYRHAEKLQLADGNKMTLLTQEAL